MAGTTKDMSLIKQVLQLKQAGESNRGVSRKLPIDKETVNNYVNTVKSNGWDISELLEIDDPELERMFHAGSPAYTDRRMQEFLSLLPEYKKRLTNPQLHVNRQTLFEEYRATHPEGYGKSQFYYHLKQNLVAKKDIAAVLSNTYKPGEKLMVDFAGDKLSYVDPDTGEIIKVEVFVACMPYSDYTYVICVPSQKTEDFLYAIRMCLEHLGGVPPILTPDNLKSAVISNDRHEPKLNKALEDMGNYYHFVVLPCDPASPTQKALVEDSVRITYNRIYARLRNRTFHSLMELNRAVWELMEKHNQTRMQKRPYSREEPVCRPESPGKLPCGAETGQSDTFLLRPLYPCGQTGKSGLYAFMGKGLCGAETGSLTHPQPFIRLYHSQGTSRIKLQSNNGTFSGILCGKGKGYIAGLS